MSDARQIPHLLELLDDEDPKSREAVGAALNAFGPGLKIELAKLPKPPTAQQRELLQATMMPVCRTELEAAWPSWRKADDDPQKLQNAFALLADYLSGYIHPEGLTTLLDRLADSYLVHGSKREALDLADYLFRRLEFKGVIRDYYHPLHSDLCHVIQTRQGIPISLTCIYMLVAWRCGLKVDGCNFPGHFLARVEQAGVVKLIDCFNGGKVVDHKVVARASEQTPWGVQQVLQHPASPQAIVARVLSNLLRAFQEMGQQADATLTARLLADFDQADTPMSPTDSFLPDKLLQVAQPKYRIGQLIRHRRYGYRGVVVDFDMRCRADDSWYRRNRTQPNREQPWYHVLVDQTDQATYAAESSLLSDDSHDEIFHPLVPQFFEKFVSGRYIRNDEPWPGL